MGKSWIVLGVVLFEAEKTMPGALMAHADWLLCLLPPMSVVCFHAPVPSGPLPTPRWMEAAFLANRHHNADLRPPTAPCIVGGPSVASLVCNACNPRPLSSPPGGGGPSLGPLTIPNQQETTGAK